MEIVLRKANVGDKAVIEDLFIEMLGSIYNTEVVEGYEGDYLSRFFDVSDDCIIVAEFKKAVIGYISIIVNREDEQYAYIDDFCVKKEYRNLGVGTQLLQSAENFAQNIGIADIRLHVEIINTSAQNLYIKSGFEIFKTEGSRSLMRKRLLIF